MQRILLNKTSVYLFKRYFLQKYRKSTNLNWRDSLVSKNTLEKIIFRETNLTISIELPIKQIPTASQKRQLVAVLPSLRP